MNCGVARGFVYSLRVLSVLFLLSLDLWIPAAAQGADAPVKIATVDPGSISVQVHRKSDLQFRKLSLSDGLSQTRVGKIIQDDQGYVWLGSQVGVNRFDGYNFRVYKHDRDDPGSLSGVYIYSIFKDRSGTIWIGTDQLLDAFNAATGKFRHFIVDKATPSVLQISQDRQGYLWLSTSQGLYRLDPNSGITKRFGHVDGDNGSLSSDDIKSTGTDKSGTFWVATANGLEAFDPGTGRVSLRVPLHMEAREFEFFEDSHGVFWIFFGTGSGLAIYDKARNTLRKLSFSNADDGLSGIYRMIETRNGDLWFATMGAGLLKFNRTDFSFDQYLNDPTDPQSITENRVIELYEDREGNVWTGLHANPPNVFTQKALPFRKVWPIPGHVNKLGESFVNAILEDRAGTVWLGAGGALQRIDRDGRLEVVDLYREKRSIEILSIVEAKDGILWIGTIGSGLISFDPQTRKTTVFRYQKGRKDWISSDVVPRLHIDDAGILWMTTWNGLDRYDPKNNTFKAFRADSSLNKEFFSLAEDRADNLWIGSRVGLVKFDKATEAFEEFRHDPADASSISNNTVNNILSAADGTLWLATHNGLTHFDPVSKKSVAFFERDGLAGSSISCILQSTDGDLWLSTNHGVSKMDQKTKRFLNYTSADGLPGDNMGGWHSCSAGADGRMYFAGFPGAAVSNPTYADTGNKNIPLRFTDIRIDDRSVLYPIRGASIPFELAYDDSLNVSFAALEFTNASGMRYRYKLAGLDADWHLLTSAQRNINYAALPAGSFTLDVQAATERGEWMPDGASISLVVAPPWWRTWWFYGIVLATVLLVLAVLYRIRLAQVAAIYNLRLEERIGERTRVARDLHDTLLQSFQGLTYRLEAVRSLLPAEPERAANMVDLILQKSDEALVEGRETIQLLRDPSNVTGDLIADVTADAEEVSLLQSDVPKPTFRVLVEGPTVEFPPDIRNEVRQICKEALRNAFKHSGGSKIECVFRFARDHAYVSIEDDGHGMVANSGFLPGAPHFGIPGLRERAARINADLNIHSEVGKGTRIELVLTTRSQSLAEISKRIGGS